MVMGETTMTTGSTEGDRGPTTQAADTAIGRDIIGRGGGDAPTQNVSLRRRIKRWLAHRLVRALLRLHRVAIGLAGLIGRRRRPMPDTCDVLLTGTFHSANWIAAHLEPLAEASRCRRVWIVTTFPVEPDEKIVVVHPPGWLRRLIGEVPSRLLMGVWMGIRRRFDVVGGFHLLMNGLTAGVVARLAGARSLYIATGGPAEILDGGIWAENRIFSKMETPDPVVEAQLVRAVHGFDLIVTRGPRARQFLRDRGVASACRVMTGGIDGRRFHPGQGARDIDVLLVGRLAAIKRVDVLLCALAEVARSRPTLTAVVVGDGEQRAELERLADKLGLSGNVQFVGRQDNVADWYRRSRVFALTSDSEGMALSLLEAMLCGVPAVVSDVGELADVVDNGVNGWLVPRRDVAGFAERIEMLLSDEATWSRFSEQARRAGLAHETGAISAKWDAILADVATGENRGDERT